MAVTTVFQASDGKVFTNVNDARAYDASLIRKQRIINYMKTKRLLRTDTGTLRDTVSLEDVIQWLVDDWTTIKGTLLAT